MAGDITIEALNRATLARQLLLERADLDPVAAIERIGGLQAQEARPAFQALWTRLRDFDRAALHDALHDRSVVRGTTLRATLHMTSAADYLALRPALQPVLDGALESVLKQRGATVDRPKVVAAAKRLLKREPLTFNALRDELAERFPDTEVRSLGYTVRMLVPLLMLPTGDRWSFAGDSRFTLAEEWLGSGWGSRTERRSCGATSARSARRPPPTSRTGRACKGLKETVEGMADELAAFKHGRRTLYDLPDAPRPDPETPAPPRLLPAFDSVLLAHQDRTRVIADEHRKALATKNLRVAATFLVDGVVAGSWAVERKGKAATLTLSAFGRLRKADKDALAAEAEALARFSGDGDPKVAFAQR